MAKPWGSVVAHCLASPCRAPGLFYMSASWVQTEPQEWLWGVSMPDKVASDQAGICYSPILYLT